MADSKTVTWAPRRGRGLVTAFSPHALGELWDSFEQVRHVFIRDGAWECRPGDALFDTVGSNQINTIHLYNKVNPDASITTKAIYVLDNGQILMGGVLRDTAASPYEIFFETVKNRVFYAGINHSPMVTNDLASAVSPIGVDPPTGSLTYTSFAATDANAKVQADSCTVANGSPNVHRVSGPNFATGSAWVGKTFRDDQGVNYVILSVTDASNLVLVANYAGSSATINAVICYGNRSWSDTPPKYAICYYNPTTGHISNPGNVLQISEKNMNNVSAYIGAIPVNSTLNGYGYTKIVLFRTGTDGLVLFPLKLTPGGIVDADGFINNSGGPTLAYQDDDGQDYNLGGILGLKEMPTINDKAPDLRLITYHDGRFWGVESARPWRVRFSGHATDIALGVPEECWPQDYFRDVKSSDGAALALKTIGSTLILGTSAYGYGLTGQDAGSYDFTRLTTRGFGVNQYAMAEHPGDGSTDSASAIYVSSDRRMWRHIAGGAIKDIGSAIQDKLDGVASLTGRKPFVVSVFRLKKLWLCYLGILNSGGTYDAYFYDFDQEAWYDWGLRNLAGAPGAHSARAIASIVYEAYGENRVLMSVDQGGPSGAIYALFEGPIHVDGGLQANMTTQHWDGGSRTVKKSMDEFRLYTNDSTAPWLVSAEFDESGVLIALVRRSTDNSPANPGQNILRWVNQTGPRQWHSVQLTWQIPGIGLKVYRAELVVRPESTGEVADPT